MGLFVVQFLSSLEDVYEDMTYKDNKNQQLKNTILEQSDFILKLQVCCLFYGRRRSRNTRTSYPTPKNTSTGCSSRCTISTWFTFLTTSHRCCRNANPKRTSVRLRCFRRTIKSRWREKWTMTKSSTILSPWRNKKTSLSRSIMLF